jgi:Siphovirus Gp157
MQNELAMSVVLYQRLKAEILRNEDGIADDDQALLDTLEGSSDINEQIAALLRDAQRCDVMSNGIAEIISDNNVRRHRLDAKSARLRAMSLAAMQECGIPKIQAPDLTISIAAGVPSVVITDEAAVPDHLCKIERTPKKNEIAKILKSGEFVPYATLSNAVPVLKVCAK